ncbi:MAG: S41 family peptidase [Treponema sp.]|nr:S41 family peptidase [Treponema sp.]
MKKSYKAFAVCFLLAVSQCFSQSSADSELKLSSFQYIKRFNYVFDQILQNYVDELDPKILYEGALKGMMEAIGDPYTVYLDPDSMRGMNDTTSGNFGGVGLTISKPTENTPEKPAYVEVASPVEDSPGAKAGIQSGDKIIAIEGEPTPPMTMNEVLLKLRGEIGTPVTITILRGANMKFDVTLVRALIEVPTVKYGMIEGTSIGYVRLIQFTPETPIRLQDALDKFQANNYTGLIMDLRDNGGGLLNSGVSVADKFISEGPIVSTKSRIPTENQQFTASSSSTTVKKDIPVVVLINRGSASASEIVAGALKDYHRAYLVGERTYGKGSVQQIRYLTYNYSEGFKYTTARYYTPSDINIDKIGIPPDLEISNLKKFTEDEEKKYIEMLNSNVISDLVEKNPNMSESDIALAAVKISKEYGFEERLVRRLIRVQVQRLQPAALYDLDWDLQLNEAIKIIEKGGFANLVKNTKTLKQLQEEAEANMAKDSESK